MLREDEALLTEHLEIVDLYQHYSTNIAYCLVSYVILNGVLVSFLGALLPAEELTPAPQLLVLIAPIVAIIGNVIFVILVKRLFDVILLLTDRGIEIERIMERRMLRIRTFDRCISHTLRLPFFKGVYVVALFIALMWVAILLLICGFV